MSFNKKDVSDIANLTSITSRKNRLSNYEGSIKEFRKNNNLPDPFSDMSFSGLKTAVRLKLQEIPVLSNRDMSDVAASFQQAVCDVLVQKTKFAIDQYEKMCQGKRLVVSGG